MNVLLVCCVIQLIVGVTVAFLPSHKIGRPLLALYVSANDDNYDVFSILENAEVLDPLTGKKCNAMSKQNNNYNQWVQDLLSFGETNKKRLVVVMPQLGDFDSAEYVEFLNAVSDDLEDANIELQLIGIGDEASAKKFASFHNTPLGKIRVDPEGKLHQQLGLHAGPNWDIPSFIPHAILEWFANYCGASGDVNAIARAWLNYMAMCAGIAAPDTLREIFRGYVGDKNAPERIKPDQIVTVGKEDDPLIVIRGVRQVKLGPYVEYEQLWKDEVGYQRPVELATVRLRNMVEVLSNFQEYVPDQRFLHYRGATFLFNEKNQLLYQHKDTGVLSYSGTMSRPLTFLQPYIGTKKALNPLQLADNNSTPL